MDATLSRLQATETPIGLPEVIGLVQAVMGRVTQELNRLHGRACLYGLDERDKDSLAAQGRALRQAGEALERLSGKPCP